MKRIFTLLTLFALAFATSPVFAQDATADTAGASAETRAKASAPTKQLLNKVVDLTPEQQAELLSQLDSQTQTSTSAKKALEWAGVGEALGRSLAATAREMGVEVNRFAQTDVGRIAMVLIVWHFMGDDILDLFGQLLVIALCVSVATFSYRVFKNTFGVRNEAGKVEGFNFDRLAKDESVQIITTLSIAGMVLSAVVAALAAISFG